MSTTTVMQPQTAVLARPLAIDFIHGLRRDGHEHQFAERRGTGMIEVRWVEPITVRLRQRTPMCAPVRGNFDNALAECAGGFAAGVEAILKARRNHATI